MKTNKKALVLAISSILLLASCNRSRRQSSSILSSSDFTSSESEQSSSSSTYSEESISSNIDSSDLSSSEQLSSESESSELPSSEELSSSEDSSEVIEDKLVVNTAPYYNPISSSGDYIAKKIADFEYGYYKENPCFIYMPIDVAISFLFPDQFKEEISLHFYRYEIDGGLNIYLDSEENIISFENFDLVNLFSIENDSPLGVIDEKSTRDYVDVSGSTYHGGKTVTLNLADYELDIIEQNNRVYVPFFLINNVFFVNTYYSPVCFNGAAFYLLDMVEGVCGLDGGSSTYMKNYYHGKFSGAERNDLFIHDNFKAFMFQLDHFYGFHDERMAPFEEYLTENYPDIITSLQSKDHTTYTDAVNKILDGVIGDGHTNSGSASTVFGTGSVYGSYYSSERTNQLHSAYYQCSNLRSNAGIVTDEVRYSGNTAILSFDGFIHSNEKLTKYNIDYKRYSDGFALFHYVFGQLANKSNIENVIFDLTCNGGGDTNALIPMLGFLTDKVELTMYNPLSQLAGDLSYKVDTNLDGKYDENDNYAGKYNFFVLTSNYSFSCANLFTKICKDSHLATIIGQQSGGGACVVSYTATPDGKPFRISGNMRDGYKENPVAHDDYGVIVDYQLSIENFYNDSKLADFVSNLSN